MSLRSRYRPHHVDAAKCPGFPSLRRNIVQYGCDLRLNQVRCEDLYALHTQRILNRDQRNGRLAEDSQLVEGLKIRLNARAARGVRTGNGNRNWLHFLIITGRQSSRRSGFVRPPSESTAAPYPPAIPEASPAHRDLPRYPHKSRHHHNTLYAVTHQNDAFAAGVNASRARNCRAPAVAIRN